MGQAGPFALGLAMAQPDKRIVLFAGDGEILMSLGVLATIANQAPLNLAIVVLDDQVYLATGGQATATAGPTDLEAIARGCGIATTCTVTKDDQVDALRDMIRDAPGPIFANAKVFAEPLPMVLPDTFDGATATQSFPGSTRRVDAAIFACAVLVGDPMDSLESRKCMGVLTRCVRSADCPMSGLRSSSGAR